jgi:hypothetical protein
MDPALRELIRRSTSRDDEPIEAIIRLDRPDADVAGIRIVSRFGAIATCRLPKASVVHARAGENVVSLKAARELGPEQKTSSDDVIRDFPLNVVHDDRRRSPDLTFTGAGVVVGFVDWGCDFRHPNFRHPDGSTRLCALWDQRGSGAAMSPRPYGYGVLHTRRQINEALRASDPYDVLGYHPSDADRDGSGTHGTHVMDIAVGNGRAGGPIGIAPEADPVFVHLADRKTGGLANLGDSVRILEAIDFIARAAGRRPWVINLSVGRHGGPHDGCTLAELALDHVLGAAPNRFVVQSAGNYFDRSTHASGHLAAGQVRSLTFITDERDLTPNELEMWYSGDDEFAIRIESPSGHLGPRVPLGEEAEVLENDRLVGRLYHRERDPNNRDNQVELFLYPSAPAGRWRVMLGGTRVRNGVFHAWLERDEACGHCQARFADTDADSSCTTGTIANGRMPLVVGAYDSHSPMRELAHFSSAGPTRDGRAKPDLVAPGVQVLAARSAPVGAHQGPDLFARKSGTSMAAPHVAGTVALCMQAASRPLVVEEIRKLLVGSAAPATPKGRFTNRVGAGYLDISRAVEAAFELGVGVRTSRIDPPIRKQQSERESKETMMEPDVEEAPWVAAGPDTLYREIVHHRGRALPTWINDTFIVLARPGEAPQQPPAAGDILVRVALGESGLGHVAVLAGSGLLPEPTLGEAQMAAESEGPGLYSTVVDGGAFPHRGSDRFARRILDRRGRMPSGQVLLRRKAAANPDLAPLREPEPLVDPEPSSEPEPASEPELVEPLSDPESAPRRTSTICARARMQAVGHDDASARVVTLLKEPIGSADRAGLDRRIRELSALFTSLDADPKAALRRRLDDPADPLGRLFDCELHRESRRRLRALLAVPPSAPGATPQPSAARSPCIRELGLVTALLPWERNFLGLVNDTNAAAFDGTVVLVGPVFPGPFFSNIQKLIVTTALKHAYAITMGDNMWFPSPIDTSAVDERGVLAHLGWLVHESVHELDYARVGMDAFLTSYIKKAVLAGFSHDAIPDERRADRFQSAALGLLSRYPQLAHLISTCDNDAIIADLRSRRDEYRRAVNESMLAEHEEAKPSEGDSNRSRRQDRFDPEGVVGPSIEEEDPAGPHFEGLTYGDPEWAEAEYQAPECNEPEDTEPKHEGSAEEIRELQAYELHETGQFDESEFDRAGDAVEFVEDDLDEANLSATPHHAVTAPRLPMAPLAEYEDEWANGTGAPSRDWDRVYEAIERVQRQATNGLVTPQDSRQSESGCGHCESSRDLIEESLQGRARPGSLVRRRLSFFLNAPVLSHRNHFEFQALGVARRIGAIGRPDPPNCQIKLGATPYDTGRDIISGIESAYRCLGNKPVEVVHIVGHSGPSGIFGRTGGTVGLYRDTFTLDATSRAGGGRHISEIPTDVLSANAIFVLHGCNQALGHENFARSLFEHLATSLASPQVYGHWNHGCAGRDNSWMLYSRRSPNGRRAQPTYSDPGGCKPKE